MHCNRRRGRGAGAGIPFVFASLVTACGSGTTPTDAGTTDALVDSGSAPEASIDADLDARADAASSTDAGQDAGAADTGARAEAGSDGSDGSAGSDGGNGTAITYTREGISLVSQDTFTAPDGTSYRRTFYRNNAYRCGRTGYYTFAVLEPPAVVGQSATLWVGLHGGGAGYYTADGHYHPGALNASGVWTAPNENENDEMNANQLAAAAIRLGQPGARILSLHMCDHDLYAGTGAPYPNDPNPGRSDDRTEGMLASISAIHFAVRGNGLAGAAHLDGYPTGLVFMHGSSAGSAGAYFVSAGMARLGIKINGAILDSYVVTTRHPELFAAGCTPLNRDPTFDIAQVSLKIGPYMSDPALLLESNADGSYALPYLVLEGTQDPHCCGPSPAVPGAVSAGFDNNCAYAYDLVSSAFTRAGSTLSRVVLIPNGGHVVLNDPDATVLATANDAVATWLADVQASNPVPPVFPP